jgi:hypothetical protein
MATTRLNVPDSINIRTLFGLPHAQQAIVDAHFHSQLPITQDVLSTAVIRWRDMIVAAFLPMLANDATITGIEAVPDITPELIKGTYTYPTPLAGTASEPVGANGVSPVISLHTPLAGRSYRGRMYLPAIPGGAVHDDLLNSDLLSNCAALIALLFSFNPIDAVGVALWQVVSRKLGVSHHVQAAAVDTLVGYQRRRTRNRGHRHHV